MENQASRKLIKVILLGDSGVGKSSLIARYVDEAYKPYIGSTVSPDFAVKEVQIKEDTICVCQIWDTAGQERFFSLCTSYFRGADAVGLVFDLTNTTASTFEKITKWRQTFFDIVAVDPERFTMVLIGNKNDCARPNTSVFKEANDKARAWLAVNKNVEYVTCSAKTGEDVVDAFAKLAIAGYNFSNSTSVSEETPLKKTEAKSEGCCN
mmetsp:Transcript_34750/g.61150  ORF Transcript_34750/g.61150 Transcript_34750/m.61150 type:complete len:209 (+) Transcript_34750:152-778(+)